MRFHDMRHTCVSLLLHLGIAPTVIRRHSDIEATMTTHAHTSLDDKRAALRKLKDASRLIQIAVWASFESRQLRRVTPCGT
jgi:integrase